MKMNLKFITPPLVIAFLAITMLSSCKPEVPEPNTYTVNFDANGGSGEMKNITGDEGSEITLTANAFTKTGYTFSEWNTKVNGSGIGYADKAKIKLTANMTLYAQWTASDYKITYNLNGGTNAEDNPDGYNAETETIALQSPTKTGYTFGGWYETEDFSGTAVTGWKAGEKTEDVTLYAKWEANTYTVKFDSNGGTGDAPADIQATYDVEFELPENTFTKTGYNFAGWNTKADGNGNSFADKAKVKNLTTENGATVTLYAKWTERDSHKISYELNGGKHVETSITSFKETEDITLGTAEKTGYTFGGWYEAEAFSGTAVTGWKAGEKTEDVTLYAKWKAIVYSITYELDGGTNADGNPESYTIEDSITLKEATKDGFTFVCWYSDRSKKTEIAKGSTGDIELQAVWKNDADFVKVPAVSITGSENWTPSSNVFVSGRNLEIKAFLMSDHEVTRGEYKEIMGSDPSTANACDKDGNKLTGDDVNNNPVNYVSWYDAIVYCNKRSSEEGLNPCYTINGSTDPDKLRSEDVTCDFTENGYRLPTEAEWEWAARGGENYKYAGSGNIGEVAWCHDNTEGSGTREVKTKKPNGYGLYDMSGNVWEWCWDWWSESISGNTPDTGASSGTDHCNRGGCFGSSSIENFLDDFNVAQRASRNAPDYKNEFFGFRVVRTAED